MSGRAPMTRRWTASLAAVTLAVVAIQALVNPTDALVTSPLDRLRQRDVLEQGPRSLAKRKDTTAVNSTMIDAAMMGMMASQRASWEQGVAGSAILEYYSGGFSVFAGKNNGPPYRPGHIRENAEGAAVVLTALAYHSVSSQDSLGRLATVVTGDESTAQGASTDSASCGEAVLLTAFLTDQLNNSASYWMSSITKQVDYLMDTVAKTPSGAISQRQNGVALWSDGVYMMPPFFAAYGLYMSNQTMLQEAYDQTNLYRNGLLLSTGPGQGMWAHILNYNTTTGASSWGDANAWATGNGWAAAGMLKTLATIAQSPYSDDMSSQKNDLLTWTREVLDSAYPFLDNSSYLFHNYINDSTTFVDSAGSALLAYSTFRLASMSTAEEDRTNIDGAETIYQSLQDQLSAMGTFYTPVVAALGFSNQGYTSPESLAFMMLLEAARRDYYTGNVTGVDGPGTGAGSHSLAATLNAASTSKPMEVVMLALAMLIGIAIYLL